MIKLIAESVEKSLLNTSVIGVTIYCLDGTICLWTVPQDVQRFVLPIRDVRAGTSSRENSWKYPSFLLHALLVTVNQVSTSYSSGMLIFPVKLDIAVFNIKPVPIASLASLANLLPQFPYVLSRLVDSTEKRLRYIRKDLLYFFLLQKHSFIFFSLALQPQFEPWPTSMKLSRFTSVFLDLIQSVGLLGRVISSSQGLYLYTKTEKRARTHTLNIHALSGIRTHDPGFRASEDNACVRPLGYRDRPSFVLPWLKSLLPHFLSLRNWISLPP
jgi:hypothetical protein